jgi:hypothetical protein
LVEFGQTVYSPIGTQDPLLLEELIECPHCAEEITAVAIRCKRCGSMLEGMGYQDLAESIRDNLAQYNYSEPCEAHSVEGVEGFVLATPRRWMTRYLCGVFTLPEGLDHPRQAKQFFEATRKSFTKRYVQFPYWKELGTYLVWICESDIFEAMEGGMTQLKDKTGLHMNVMLGTVLVDRQELVTSAEAAWGLYYSGKHFGAISASVNEWCKRVRAE